MRMLIVTTKKNLCIRSSILLLKQILSSLWGNRSNTSKAALETLQGAVKSASLLHLSKKCKTVKIAKKREKPKQMQLFCKMSE